jgi:hypothetical protein
LNEKRKDDDCIVQDEKRAWQYGAARGSSPLKDWEGVFAKVEGKETLKAVLIP